MIFTTISAIALATTAGVTVPQPSADTLAAAVSTVAAAPARVAKAKPTVYCVEEMITGSRMPRRVCATRDRWLDRGFDPLLAKRK